MQVEDYTKLTFPCDVVIQPSATGRRDKIARLFGTINGFVVGVTFYREEDVSQHSAMMWTAGGRWIGPENELLDLPPTPSRKANRLAELLAKRQLAEQAAQEIEDAIAAHQKEQI